MGHIILPKHIFMNPTFPFYLSNPFNLGVWSYIQITLEI